MPRVTDQAVDRAKLGGAQSVQAAPNAECVEAGWEGDVG